MEQLDLLSDILASRNTDPLSSHIAKRDVTLCGARATQQHVVLDLVRRFPGRSSAELAKKSITGPKRLDRWQVARRTADLESADLIRSGDLRKCSLTGKKCKTFYPVAEAV